MVAVHVNSVLSGEKFTLKLGLKTTFDKIRNSFQYKELQFIYFKYGFILHICIYFQYYTQSVI